MNRGVNTRRIRVVGWIVLLLLTVAQKNGYGQVPGGKMGENLGEIGEMGGVDSTFLDYGEKNLSDSLINEKDSLLGVSDSLTNELESSEKDSLFEVSDSLIYILGSREKTKSEKEITPFKPNPKKATIAAAMFPGLGQIYNRQYWKLPIVYGGLMGCLYAITWNNKTYADYKEAYFSIMKDAKADPQTEHPEEWSDRWQIFVPGSIDPATRLHDTNFQNNLKRGKDYFRRYRELSWIIMVAVYGITVADAYVDAQMFDFDVSPDLSFHVTPLFVPETFCNSRSYGITICMNF